MSSANTQDWVKYSMENHELEGDQLFLIAEGLAKDFSLFPPAKEHADVSMQGLLSKAQISRQYKKQSNLDIDSYIEQVIAPAENPGRVSAPEIIAQLGGRVTNERSDGSFYSAIVDMDFGGSQRLVGFIAQDRSVRNGVWGPEHHMAAANIIEEYSKRSIPIVSMMDTPGADPGEQANINNQAHSISRLITEMCNVDVPNIGIVFGLGYSGGAIPLAASNLIFSVRDGVFSTIQPKGLASIARRLNLSWQECAKYVGVSPFELYRQGNIDGVIDYKPGETGESLNNLRLAIVTGILSIESRTMKFVAENPYILAHYKRSLNRYLNTSEQLQSMETSAGLNLTKCPTEYDNLFGMAFRYLRYLGTRKRIKATTKQQYGRLSDQELPAGELASRADLERRQVFLRWLQDPEKVIYSEQIAKAWKTFNEKKQAVHDERGRIAQLIFGEPRKNYEDARQQLLSTVSMYLYNRWKSQSAGNLQALKQYLKNHEDARRIVRVAELKDPVELLNAIKENVNLGNFFTEQFTHEGRKLLLAKSYRGMSENYLRTQLATEINLLLTSVPFSEKSATVELSREASKFKSENASSLKLNRQIFDDEFSSHIHRANMKGAPLALSEMTVLDVLTQEELRQEFISECENLLLFDSVYDQLINNLDSVAEEANSTRNLAQSSLEELLDTTLSLASRGITVGDLGLDAHSPEEIAERLREQFFSWYLRIAGESRSGEFFRAVEEWKKGSFAAVSDTLLVVVTFIFENLLVSFLRAKREGKRYDGSISPRNIGRRKDFWNRLGIAYHDLLLQNLLKKYSARPDQGHHVFVEEYFTNFEELNEDLLSSDPCEFPGFRVSIEKALKNGIPPCGIVTGLADFDDGKQCMRVGTAISNVAFQAGSFDMASAEKFCKLLVTCAERHLPVICFVSSGGMQTKEGAGALFSMAAVNDRITRFVRDNDLPVIIFGYGNCTGGAQASFVTHPLVQTYYFSGTFMPFAGQIVVQENLPYTSTLSNYLSTQTGSMQGLVKHPFYEGLDEELQKIDGSIPVPTETVRDVVQRVMSGSLLQARPVTIVRGISPKSMELAGSVKRVLIHARGCTAVKLIRIAQQNDIDVVLVQSDPDMDSVAVDMLGESDKVVCIGGNTADESYLNAQSVLSVAEHEKVDSLHPGIGFLSENSQFAELCRLHGINFIGPPVASMNTMGNKSNAINTSLRLDVPVVPGSHGILTSAERAADVAESIGYPVLIKAVHGGGGKGIQVVEKSDNFHELFHQVTAEAKAAFGNGDVYLEKYVTSLRHIEVQLLRDKHGNTHVLGLRDCSVQRDKQKVIEESESTMLTQELRESVLTYTKNLADEVSYEGAGTVEFIYDLANKAVYFMEMNTRLQVEHPVTEHVSGIDIVKQQFRIASNENIADLEVQSNGYSMEVRITAERLAFDSNGVLKFHPDPGEIQEYSLPEEDGVEVISTVAAGKFVSPFYDSLIAQVIVHSTDRSSTIEKMLEYLGRARITGISTNIPLLQRVLKDDVFRKGIYDTDYLPGLLQRTDAEGLIEEIKQASGVESSGIDLESIKIEDSDELKVLCPSTGIFYSTPTPTEPDFVSVGDKVDIASTLCQLEAFKIFSPLSLKNYNAGEDELYSSSQKYEIMRINMASGQQVNAGDLLFVVRPVAAR
ncbi:MAG: ATP-grasp domain-containing protein [Pseudomonadales bacterium]|nr:ATP-grasp domain-containing protein [Pseudomonadales bacterium]